MNYAYESVSKDVLGRNQTGEKSQTLEGSSKHDFNLFMKLAGAKQGVKIKRKYKQRKPEILKDHQNQMDRPNAGGSHFHSLGLRLRDGQERSLNIELGDT